MVKLSDIISGPHQVVPERGALFNVPQYEEIKSILILSIILTEANFWTSLLFDFHMNF